jgi:hypothetical protein
MVPASLISHLQTLVAPVNAMPSIRLAVVGFLRFVDLDLNDEGFNSGHRKLPERRVLRFRESPFRLGRAEVV